MANNQFAVITGASSGIGFELARLFARNGFDILITSEDAGGIGQAASTLRGEGATVTTHIADLAHRGGTESLIAAIDGAGRPVDALAANAGFGLGGRFTETDVNVEFDMIAVNVISTTQLVKHVAQQMAARRQGRILITGSIAGIMPGSFQSVYNGTKAYLDNWGEAIRNELKDQNVVVTVLMPGPTETNFFHRAEMDDTDVGQNKKMDPAPVAEAGYNALMADDDHVVAGFKNKFQAAMAHLLPWPTVAERHRQMAQPHSEKEAAE
ncbi:MAG: SDR family NAD(P)-dependent oxidoreductase [Sphingomonadaceae bacterium]|nr:SDR family NAD(P)-dependent oxidoreductase [Sphingomonadaceae bacterium]